MGVWVARIPDIKADHNLSDALFGAILICGIGGALLAFPFVGTIVDKFGSKGGVLAASISASLLLPIVGISRTPVWILCLGIAGLQ